MIERGYKFTLLKNYSKTREFTIQKNIERPLFGFLSNLFKGDKK